ncbi:NADP-binding protein [Dacryopinax primogenitus]|uniref:NADP-binding protein n=1 Tax=Dacryopinax primogenitus (strain DJM 731) TaxID=1858805 RepID=M5GGQ2_DACPD|nr:NADP-binding protein [Dacryopinax primogenitus]EJU05883.1 NADP-binding protein [Dacryopinax primogenitus]
MSPTVYLISGANRGIGLSLVEQLAARPDVIVFAGARDPTKALALQALKSKFPERVYLVKLTSANKQDNEEAVAKVSEIAGRLDVVIANAGISNAFYSSLDTPLDAMQEHFVVNVLGPLALFQAAYPLLKTSTSSPKFFPVSSLLGSIQVGTVPPIKATAYGTSKAAVNWLAARLYYEYPDLISLPIHPGTVDTDMAANAISHMPELIEKFSMITTEESAAGILKVVDAAKRDESGPKMTSYDGSALPW